MKYQPLEVKIAWDGASGDIRFLGYGNREYLARFNMSTTDIKTLRRAVVAYNNVMMLIEFIKYVLEHGVSEEWKKDAKSLLRTLDNDLENYNIEK